MRNVMLLAAILLVAAGPLDAQNCKKGKPCGNTCIARSKTCHVGQGTATWAPGFKDTLGANTKAATKAIPLPAKVGGYLTCTVSKITDGDTLRCEEYSQAVRLLLIDAPEMSQGPFGEAARDRLLELVPVGSTVQLEFDVQTKDRYNRGLAYVWSGTTMANVEMARSGYALSLTYPPNVKYVVEVRDRR